MINRINLPSNLKSIIALIRNISFMGSCASRVIESTLIPYKDGYTEHQVKAEAGDPEMGERSDYNDFLETYNRLLSMATETYRRCDDLSNSYSEIQKQNEQLTADNEFLRQRYENLICFSRKLQDQIKQLTEPNASTDDFVDPF